MTTTGKGSKKLRLFQDLVSEERKITAHERGKSSGNKNNKKTGRKGINERKGVGA